MKTGELTDAALDWAVAKAIGEYEPVAVSAYSANWAQGGPIIERESIRWNKDGDVFYAWTPDHEYYDPLHEPWTGDTATVWRGFAYGESLLIAAMRCYVASKLGEDVDVPEELT